MQLLTRIPPWFASSLVVMLLLAWSGTAIAAHPFLLRDHPGVMLAPKGQVEISLEYLMMNDTVDIFDIRDEEIESVNRNLQSTTLGDLNGGRLLINYGLLSLTTLHGEYTYRNVDLSVSDFQVHSLELSVRQGLLGYESKGWPLVALDAGVRLNFGEDIHFDQIDRINSVLRLVNPDLSINDTGSDLVFSDGTNNYEVSKAGRDPLKASIEDLLDHTWFIRLTVGKPLGPVLPNLFAEYGHNEIDSRITSNIDQYLPASIFPAVSALPLELDRSENYWKVGCNLHFSLPFDLQGYLEYHYLRMDRDNGLDFVDYNHVVKGNLAYFLTDYLAINLGASYYSRQFNGVIPFLYNEYTQTGFDHDYAFVHMGLSGIFGP